MKDLKVSSIQAHLHWEDKEENLKMFAKLIENVPSDSDLILLPEMFSTGFSMNAEALAEEMTGKTVEWMKIVSKEKNVAIAGSLIIKEAELYFNRLVFVEPNGTIKFYDKRHLFSMGEEHKHYHAGTEKHIIEFKDWKINLSVCYDLRFPVWLRNNKNNPYDVLIVLANWPEKRIEHWDTLLKARAIENQVYVLGVNRIGVDGNNIMHIGHSSAYDAYGTQLNFSEDACILNTSLSKDHLLLIRRQYPFLRDKD